MSKFNSSKALGMLKLGLGVSSVLFMTFSQAAVASDSVNFVINNPHNLNISVVCTISSIHNQRYCSYLPEGENRSLIETKVGLSEKRDQVLVVNRKPEGFNFIKTEEYPQGFENGKSYQVTLDDQGTIVKVEQIRGE